MKLKMSTFFKLLLSHNLSYTEYFFSNANLTMQISIIFYPEELNETYRSLIFLLRKQQILNQLREPSKPGQQAMRQPTCDYITNHYNPYFYVHSL